MAPISSPRNEILRLIDGSSPIQGNGIKLFFFFFFFMKEENGTRLIGIRVDTTRFSFLVTRSTSRDVDKVKVPTNLTNVFASFPEKKRLFYKSASNMIKIVPSGLIDVQMETQSLLAHCWTHLADYRGTMTLL